MPTYKGPNPEWNGKIVSKEQLKELEKKDKEAAKAAGTKTPKSNASKTSSELFNEKSLEEIETKLIPSYLEKRSWNVEQEAKLQNGLYDTDCVLMDSLSFGKVLSWDPETKTAKVFNGIGEKTGLNREYDVELTHGLLNDSGKIGLRSGLPIGSIIAYREEKAKMRKTVREGTFGVSCLVDRWVDVTHRCIFAVIPESKYASLPIPKALL
jgi:hypothetical protein